MIDSPTDTSLTKGRGRSAPGMSHADTHTPLHGPTGGVPSHKALSDNRIVVPFAFVTRSHNIQGLGFM
eukprot:scaffold20962_cov112-Isochrysis_galbana.AAC.11